MQQYLLRHIGAEQALGGLLGSACQTGPDLPKFLQDQLIFPYLGGLAVRPGAAAAGRRDVEARRPRRPRARAGEHRAGHAPGEVGGGREAAAGAARRRARRRLAAHRRAGPGASGRRASCSAATDEAAAGWGGDRYELWQRGGVRRAAVPRHRRAGDEVALGQPSATRASSRPRCAARASDGAAVEARGDTVTLVLAPDAALARRVAQRRLAPAELRAVRALRRRAVDHVVEPVVDVGEDLRLLRLGQLPVLDGLVELLRHVAFIAAFRPATSLFCALATSASDLPSCSCSRSCVLGQPEVVRRAVEAEARSRSRDRLAEARAARPRGLPPRIRPAEQRRAPFGEPLLGRLALLLRELARRRPPRRSAPPRRP